MKLHQKLSYISLGRGGYVIYHDDQGEIKFDYEFGGGDCVAIIFVPEPYHWHNLTGRNEGERLQILTFVAEQAIRDQAPGCRYEISDKFIELWKRAD